MGDAVLRTPEVREALDALLERRTDETRLTSMGAGSDDLDDGRAYLAATVDGGWHVPTWPAEHGGRNASPAENHLIGSVLREYVVPDLYPFAIGLGMVGPRPAVTRNSTTAGPLAAADRIGRRDLVPDVLRA